MVSRGGIMLMSLTPKGDGSIDPQGVDILKGMGAWLKPNGEAIYGTRRWHTAAEASYRYDYLQKGKGGYRWDFRRVTAEDIRYTRSKDNTKLYAIALGKPESGKSVMAA